MRHISEELSWRKHSSADDIAIFLRGYEKYFSIGMGSGIFQNNVMAPMESQINYASYRIGQGSQTRREICKYLRSVSSFFCVGNITNICGVGKNPEIHGLISNEILVL